jgi:very-short-patch-repair endonuclease
MQLFNRDAHKEIRRKLRKNQTDAERKLWAKLRNRQFHRFKWFRQYSTGPYIVDFYCPTLHWVLEIDGGQHYEASHAQNDRAREQYLLSLGIRTIRITNTDALKNTAAVLRFLESQLPPEEKP